MALELWVIEYRNTKDDKGWDISDYFESERVANATMADKEEQPTSPMWQPEYRVRRYVPAEPVKKG